MHFQSSLNYRIVRAGVHLSASVLVSLLVSIVVFFVWYPEPYRTLSGGVYLFSILVAVDVTIGPLATFVVSKPGKPLKEWRTDVSLIALVQVVALMYGVWSLYQARPVYMAFEVDRLRVVHAVDVPPELLAQAPDGFRKLPIAGPSWVAVRPLTNGAENMQATMAALQGLHLAFRPDFWIAFEQASEAVRQKAKPLSELIAREPQLSQPLLQALKSHNVAVSDVVYLPLLGRTKFWTALFYVNSLKPFAYLPIDPYGS